MLPSFADLYKMAFSWDPEFEFQSVWKLLTTHGIQGDSLVADAGAGTGRFVSSVVNHGLRCYAIEPDPDMFKVLESVIDNFPPASKSNAIAIHSSFESFDPSNKFDAIIAMTDTLSYVLPETRLSSFLSHAKYSLKEGGVFVIDVALWANYLGEARFEQWSSEDADWVIHASCSANISQLPEQQVARRFETLTFEARRGEQVVERTHKSEIFGFSFESIIDAVHAHGFKYCEAIEPGHVDAIDPRISCPKRAFLCFVNE